MTRMNEGALRLALGRVKWAVNASARHAEPRWEERLLGAIASLHEAWERHVETAGATFAQVIDRSVLPFTPLAQRASEFTQDHADLGAELTSLREELAGARAGKAFASTGSLLVADRTRVEKRSELRQKVERLIAAMEWHLVTEDALLQAETVPDR